MDYVAGYGLLSRHTQIIEDADKAAGVVLGQTAVSFFRNFSKTRQGKRYSRVMEECDRGKELSAAPLAA